MHVQQTVSLTDVFRRPLRDLRISVTDRCNFRCVYCMPKEVFGRDYQFLPSAKLITFEEITRLARVFADHGTRKLRLTGGEPLVRRDIEKLVEMLAGIQAIEDIALTTNGSLLAQKAQALKDAGLKRITVSLDSLDDATFKAMNDVDFPVGRVLEGIEAAAAAGLMPIKVNMVVKRGMNEQSIVPMARYFRQAGHILRLIEYMDVGHSNGWKLDDVVPASEMIEMIGAEIPLERAAPNYAGEVANRFFYKDGSGEVGIIASVSEPFCGACSRARLSSEGSLFTCLFATRGTDFRGPLREGWSDDEIANLLRSLWTAREDRYSEIRTAATRDLPKIEMSYVGG